MYILQFVVTTKFVGNRIVMLYYIISYKKQYENHLNHG